MYRWFAWNVLFRLHECAKGHTTFNILKDMQAADHMSACAMAELRQRKLRELIAYAYQHVPHTRRTMTEAGIAPGDIRDIEDLRRLPVMGKVDMRKHREALRSDIARNLSVSSTGGSTGEPLLFELSKRRIGARVACRQRASLWWGVAVGDPEFAVWGSPVELSHQDRIRNLRDRLLATRLLPAFQMSEATMSRYLDVIERRGCRQLFGYPSAIDLLCRHAAKEGRDLRGLGIKVVFVTGEVLLPHQRQNISQTFAAPVANGYGGRDSGFISHECPHGGMHVLDDAVVVEILDPERRPVKPGETGEIVVTDLYSHEFPFIRYATGDMASASVKWCACGRPLTLLDRIEGRSNDFIFTPDGRTINALSVIYAVREVGGIEHFRIIQKTLDHLHVRIVAGADFRKEGEYQIRDAWTALFRAPLSITFEYVPALPCEASGKFRHVTSEIMHGAGRFAEAGSH